MNKSESVRNFFSEGSLINVVVRVAPYGASFIPANFTYKNSRAFLGASHWEAMIYAGVVELLGISTVHMTMKLVEETRKKRLEAAEKGKETKTGYGQAVLTGFMAVFYLTAVILVNVLLDLDQPTAIIVARALLSMITIPAAVTLSMYNLYALRTGADTSRHKIASLRGKLGSLQAKFNRLQEKAGALRGECEGLQSRIGEMGEALQVRDRRVAELERVVARLERENGKLQRVAERPFESLPIWDRLNPTAQASLRYLGGEYSSMQAAADEVKVNKSTIQRVVKSLNGAG